MAYDPDLETIFTDIREATLVIKQAVDKAAVDLANLKKLQADDNVAVGARLDKLEHPPVVSGPSGPSGATGSTGPVLAAKFPGDVAPGFVRWGAAIDGNADPSLHEGPAGGPLGVRRTFYQWSGITNMVNTAKADVTAGRLPWVSVKPSGSWFNMASGTMDAQIDDMLKRLDAAGGPVWLSVHHEPEGGAGSNVPDDTGGPTQWIAMQKKIRARMTALATKNIAFGSILMAYTFDPASGRNPAEWWADGVWDFAGIDHYVETTTKTMTNVTPWINAMSFYKTKGIKVAVGEWGNRGNDTDAANDMQAFYDTATVQASPQIVALAYFDSGLNAPNGSWELTGAPLTKFRQLMTAPKSLTVKQFRK